MVERYLLAFLARARSSKGGALLIILGVVLLVAFWIFGLVSVAGDAILMMIGVGPVVEFLGTGPGVLAGFVVSVFIILLGVAFLTRAVPQSTSSAVIQVPGTSQTERNHELEQLRNRLRRTEQERNQLRARLADPIAMKRYEEEMLRTRCLELAQVVYKFGAAHRPPYNDEQEMIDRFRRRHGSKVTELREELDRRGWLTAQERESLPISAHDSPDKILQMSETLKSIGMGR